MGIVGNDIRDNSRVNLLPYLLFRTVSLQVDTDFQDLGRVFEETQRTVCQSGMLSQKIIKRFKNLRLHRV